MRHAVVTGAAGGIGRAMCAAFAQAGYRVLGIDRTAAPAGAGDWLMFDLATLSDEQAVERFGAELGRLLPEGLEVLVNNAAEQVVKPLEELRLADWRVSLDVNLLAPFWLVQALAPKLRQARGSVVNVASIHAELTKAGFTAYSTSKGALVSLTRALAIELAPDVRVNAILPAAIDTGMLRRGFEGNEASLARLGDCHPMGRIGRAEEVAALAVFLAGPACGFLTGEAIRVDGGIGGVLHDPAATSASRGVARP